MKLYQIEFGTPEYDETVRMRYAVLREPLGLDFSIEMLEEEFADIHLALYDDYSNLIACLVLSPQNQVQIKMRQVAVLPGKQKSGAGSALVKFSETWSARAGYSEMIMHARETAVSFYEKLGYKKSGKRFEEVSIPHWFMKKELISKQ
ncbi:MAG: GNAT family N-acetyltransferase [Saprospiraceae bacterium]|nr:GNAT family N-acetyltransferase [Saprospiraceae bacterium]